ncbi:hypothetical protein E5163_14885 [Marinicauda algicola]|uniref:Phage gp6-like head-tail connector protein n=1 Tax=Marinicauda algicola TaxID=2029849 RepID=A0A4S2GWX8_9PROT|nr:head-tail connector protein [Marinicauda algicola]TGY87351.1 hypothetical protein E5163_14885 [Marinicauda algicola]
MGYTLITAPAAEPLSLADAKAHLRVDFTADDGEITDLIAQCRAAIETWTRRKMIAQTWERSFAGFPLRDADPIELDLPPVASITSISYVDEDGATQTFAAEKYILEAGWEPGRIHLAYEQEWPATRAVANAVTVRFVTGRADAAAVKEKDGDLIAALKLLLAHWYQNAAGVNVGNIVNEMPLGVRALLDPYRNY